MSKQSMELCDILNALEKEQFPEDMVRFRVHPQNPGAVIGDLDFFATIFLDTISDQSHLGTADEIIDLWRVRRAQVVLLIAQRFAEKAGMVLIPKEQIGELV